MAKWQVKKVQELLFEKIVPRFEEFEDKVNRVTKESMLDPEDLEGVLYFIRKISTVIQNINNQLFLAYTKPKEFVSLINSTQVMHDELVKVRKSLEENSPGDERIEAYTKKEAESFILLSELKMVKKILDFPNRKKKYYRAVNDPRNIKVFDYNNRDIFESLDTLLLAGERALEELL